MGFFLCLSLTDSSGDVIGRLTRVESDAEGMGARVTLRPVFCSPRSDPEAEISPTFKLGQKGFGESPGGRGAVVVNNCFGELDGMGLDLASAVGA